MKKFKTEDIVSCATGRLAGDMDGIYEVLGYLTGEDLYTHMLPEASNVMDAELRRQCPWVDEVDLEGLTPDNHKAWLKVLHEKFGTEHELTPAPELWGKHDPIADLVGMMNDDQELIVVGNS